MIRRCSIAALLSCACTPVSPPAQGTTPSVQTRAEATPDEPAGPRRFVTQLGGQSIDSLADAALSSDGQVALLGDFDDTLWIDAADGEQSSLSEEIEGMIGGAYLVVQDAQGRTRWGRALHDRGTLVARSVAFAPNGDVVVAGWFDGEVALDGRVIEARSKKQPLYSRGDEDGFIARYAPGGGLLRIDTFGGPGGLDIADLAVAPDGDVIVAGSFTGTLTIGGRSVRSSLAQFSDNAFVARLDTKGQTRWLTHLGSKRQDDAKALALTAEGEVIVAGDCQGSIRLGDSTFDCNEHGGSPFVATLDDEGAVSWGTVLLHHEYAESEHDFTATATGVAALSDGGMLLTVMHVEDLDIEESVTFASNGWTDAAVVRFDADKNIQWARAVGSKGADRLEAPVSDGHGGAWIAGSIAGPPAAVFGETLEGEGMAADDPPLEVDNIHRWPTSAIFVHIDSEGSFGPAVRLGGEPGTIDTGRDLEGRTQQLVEGRRVFVDYAGRLRLVGMFLGPLNVPQVEQTRHSRGGVERVGNEDDAFVVGMEVPGA